jgi:methyltransferase (TIGR00027 family)
MSAGASRTAQYMALFRALETGRGRGRLFTDTLARRFLPPRLRAVAALARLPGAGLAVERILDYRWPGARASGVARTRLIDDWTVQALDAGAEQVVILGSGFDARAYRLPSVAAARVFEVDQPATIDAKREAIRAARGRLPDNVAFLPVDFSLGGLGESLTKAGLDAERPTCVIWEGVTHYLSAEAVADTLDEIASLVAPSSRLLFTYVHRGVIDGSVQFDAAETALAAVERADEPWTFGLCPEEVRPFLAAAGYRLLEDLSSREYRQRFLPAKARYLRGYEFYRAALAEIGPAN